ncbi:hypothetical protein LTR66_016397, partial [Elasticomyces elasticus]
MEGYMAQESRFSFRSLRSRSDRNSTTSPNTFHPIPKQELTRSPTKSNRTKSLPYNDRFTQSSVSASQKLRHSTLGVQDRLPSPPSQSVSKPVWQRRHSTKKAAPPSPPPQLLTGDGRH